LPIESKCLCLCYYGFCLKLEGSVYPTLYCRKPSCPFWGSKACFVFRNSRFLYLSQSQIDLPIEATCLCLCYYGFCLKLEGSVYPKLYCRKPSCPFWGSRACFVFRNSRFLYSSQSQIDLTIQSKCLCLCYYGFCLKLEGSVNPT
jgi:hypothetical protein